MPLLRHVVLMKWSRELSPDELDKIHDAITTLVNEADTVRIASYGPDARAGSDRADYALVVDFEDIEGWKAYSSHPAHDPVRMIMNDYVAESFKVQFWVDTAATADQATQ